MGKEFLVGLTFLSLGLTVIAYVSYWLQGPASSFGPGHLLSLLLCSAILLVLLLWSSLERPRS